MRSAPLLRRAHITVAVLAVLAALLWAAASGARDVRAAVAEGTADAPSEQGSVRATMAVIVLAPYLTWEDVNPRDAPELCDLARAGATANMNCITEDDGWPTLGGGALTISSSRWAAGPVNAPVAPGSASAIRAANASSLNPPEFGALGHELRAAGLKTAALGNSDTDTTTPAGIKRPAALAACDRDGAVDLDFTDPSILAPSRGSPFGKTTSPSRVASAMAEALAAKSALLVIDTGDLERAHDATSLPAGEYAAAHRRAVRRASALVGAVHRQLLEGHARPLMLIVSPATDKPYYEPPYFGPVLADGNALTGDLTSGSTHRPGLVTNLDIAPTVLSAFGLPPSRSMLGQPMTGSGLNSAGGGGTTRLGSVPDALSSRVAAYEQLGTSVGAIDYTRDLLFTRRFAPAAAWLAIALAGLALLPAARRLWPAGRWIAAATLSIPPAAWLMFAIDRYPESPSRVLLALAVATAFVFGLAAVLPILLGRRAETATLALSALTALIIAADQWSGHAIESGLFSYSIRAGWRYYGMGNEGAALLVGASLVATGIGCDLARGTRWERLLRGGAIPAVAAIAITTIAAPFAGANAGAAIWGVVAYVAAWVRVNRIRLTWKSIGATAAGIAAIVCAIAIVDIGSGRAGTHIGRFFAELATGDFGNVRALVVRKAINNITYIPLTPYTWLALALVAALVALRWLGRRPLAETLAAHPGMAAGLLGVLAGSAVAALTEDSGIVMPALLLLTGALPVVALTLQGDAEASSGSAGHGTPAPGLDPHVA